MGEKKCKCDKCNKGYTKNQTLKQHIASAHFGKTHTCPECGLKIKDQSNLRKHILRIHNKDRKSSKSPEKKKQRLKLLDNIEGLPEIEPCLGFNLEEMINDGYSNEAAQCLANSWEFVRTGYKGGKLKCEYNIRLKQEHVDVDLLKTYLMQIHKIQPNAYRINIAWGSLMQHIETGEWKYFHTSNPASRYWKEPITIRSEEDLLKALEYIDAQDIVDHISLKRDNTKFVVNRIVNFNVVVFPMQGHTLLGNTISLPPHIIKHQFIKPLIKDSHQNEYKNTNCCFRCISYHLNGNSEMGLKKNAMRLSDQFRKFIDVPLGKFNGKITLDQLLQVELCFGLRISVYSLVPKVNDDNELDEEKNATEFYNESNLNRFEATLVRGSSTKISEAKNGELFLDLTMDHFSVITSIENYACSFSCNTCKKLFKTRWDCTRHQKRCFRDDNKQRAVHIAGTYKMPENIFYQLEQTGFKLNENDKFCEYFTAFDFETVNAILKDDDPRRRLGQKLVFSRILELGSCSIISSVAGFQKPYFIKRKTSESEFMNRVVDYLCAIAERSQEVQREKLAHVFEQINEKIESINKSIKESSDIEVEEYNKYLLKKHTRLQTELEKYVKSHVIYAFNGSRFDLKVAHSYLLEQLLNRKIKVTSVIKRQNAYVLLATPTLVFKDMTSLLAPGTSLQSFFQAFDLPVSKWAFPYGYITNLSKLDETELPAYSEFWSSLKGKYLVSEEGYKEIAEWYKLNAKCLWDYLEEYNNRDVISMIPGLELLRQFWKCYGICMVQSGISLSSLSARLMHKSVPKNSPFIWLPGKHESYVHDLASGSVVGGPALIWTRYGEKDKTYIRNGPNICKSILGIDANALYLSALAKDMPTSYAVAWQLDKKGQNFDRKVLIPPW